jgi:hypothetical protein
MKTLRKPEMPFYYNVRESVGPNAANQRADVLLVQYLLRTIYANAAALAIPPLPSGRVILVDGLCGSITNEAILHFQKSVKAKQQAIPTDGRVDRAYPGAKTPHGLQWTIIFMNFAFHHSRPAVHADLPAASDCPPELREALL